MTAVEMKKNLKNCRKALESIVVTGANQGGLLKGIANVLDQCIADLDKQTKPEEVKANV